MTNTAVPFVPSDVTRRLVTLTLSLTALFGAASCGKRPSRHATTPGLAPTAAPARSSGSEASAPSRPPPDSEHAPNHPLGLSRWLGTLGHIPRPSGRTASAPSRPVTSRARPERRVPETPPARTDRPPPPLSPSPDVGPLVSTQGTPPPERPSATPFGYSTPYTGCIEGRLVRVPRDPGIRLALLDWDRLPPLARLWACEWNVERQPGAEASPLPALRAGWFAIRYEGSFQALRGGRYRFRLESDDGARLLLDGRLVIADDGLHAARSRTGEVTLRPGPHTLRLEYLQGPGSALALRLFVRGPSGREGLFSLRPRP